MKKTFKKILSLSLSVCIFAAMTISASAAEPRATYAESPISNFIVWHNKAHHRTGDFNHTNSSVSGVLNALTDGNVIDYTRVTNYYYTADEIANQTQQFAVYNLNGKGYRAYVKNQFDLTSGTGYTLNYNTVTGKCVMYRDLASERSCSEIDLRTIGNCEYRVLLEAYDKYLTSPAALNAQDIVWSNYKTTDQDTQAWMTARVS